MASRAINAVSTAESERMGANIEPASRPFTRRPAPSLSLRLAQVYEVAKPKTAATLYVLSCHRVALGNRVYLEAGDTNTVTTRMAEIDASLAPQLPVDLMTALHEAEMHDCWEQPADETFREKLRQGIATVEDGQHYISKSASARFHAERAEVAVRRWIEGQKEGEA